SRDRSDSRRSKGLYEAVDGDLAPTVRCRYRADRRNLRRGREVLEQAQMRHGSRSMGLPVLRAMTSRIQCDAGFECFAKKALRKTSAPTPKRSGEAWRGELVDRAGACVV